MVHIRIEEIEKFAKENHVPIMLPDGINYLTNYIKDNNIKNILEIGTAIGYSSIRMSLVDPKIHVTTIERDKTMYDNALKNIESLKLNSQIDVIYADALDVDITGSYDLIFIDAAKSQYIKFFNKFTPLLKKGGVVVTDNLSFHGMVENPELTHNRNTKQMIKKIKQYITFLENNKDYDTQFTSIGDGIAVSKKIN